MHSTTESSDVNGKVPFPYKLFYMLNDADEKGFRHIVSWNSTGTSFKVHDSATFTKYIVPKYFKQTRYKSFQRQLCLYGFDRVLTGHHKGSRYHNCFVRGNLKLCNEIKYIGIKSKALQQKSAIKESEKTSPIKQTPTPSAAIKKDIKQEKDNQNEISVPQCALTNLPENLSDSEFLSETPRIISPTLSPVASELDDLHDDALEAGQPTPLAEMKELDEMELFDGMAFHSFIDPTLTEMEAIGNDDNTTSWQSTAPNPLSSTSGLPPRQVSCGNDLDSGDHGDMFEAWQSGYEHSPLIMFTDYPLKMEELC